MAKREDPPFGALVKHLEADAHSAVRYVGYLKAIVNNKVVPQKCSDSFCGYALATAESGVKRALVLYCTRIWEDKPGLASLPRAKRLLPSAKELRKRDRSKRLAECIVPWNGRCLDDIESQCDAYLSAYELASKSGIHKKLRALRNESFAHNFAESHERREWDAADGPIEPTFNELIEVATKSLELVDGLTQLWDGVRNSPNRERIDTAERQCREFWRVLPVLRDVERL